MNDLESIGTQDLREIALRLELLETKLREREQAVVDLLRELCKRVDSLDGLGLESRKRLYRFVRDLSTRRAGHAKKRSAP